MPPPRRLRLPPGTRPVVLVDTSKRLRHEIRVVDEETPNSRRRPAGTKGYELLCKTDDPAPIEIAGCQYLGTFTKPHIQIYGGVDGGKTVHYISRWVNGVGESGPLSETVSATIPA